MNSPTWTTVFAAMCVGVGIGQGFGVIIGMAFERWQRDVEETIEDMVRKRKDKNESKPDE